MPNMDGLELAPRPQPTPATFLPPPSSSTLLSIDPHIASPQPPGDAAAVATSHARPPSTSRPSRLLPAAPVRPSPAARFHSCCAAAPGARPLAMRHLDQPFRNTRSPPVAAYRARFALVAVAAKPPGPSVCPLLHLLRRPCNSTRPSIPRVVFDLAHP